ncbi:LysO family transporter [uncultured Bacteroides sp.]|uniref:LysO family transporter n=1 Tax=uncultured Bacteroides sp. TaxID=162156 RepID=UPI002602CA11|nr:LysO family transporter [uncultured Bacteroides sp.]
MFTVILIMFAGIILGVFTRKYQLRPINKLITILIWLLLFILGIEVGSNREIINGLATLGLEAIVITICAVLGSCVCAWALWYILYKRKKGAKA